jgi:hypothetical protein
MNDVGQEERLEPINSGDAPSPSGDNNNTRNNQWRGNDMHGARSEATGAGFAAAM